MRKVVVTGIGLMTPIGIKQEDVWQNLLDGVSGIDKITQIDTTGFSTNFGGEVKDFDITNWIDKRDAKRVDRFVHLAIAASMDAVADSGLDLTKEDPTRVGVIIGSGIGGIREMEEQYERFMGKGPSKISPFVIPKLMANSASGNVSIELGVSGPNFTTTTACAAGAHALGEALRVLQHGSADVMVAGGSEGAISNLGLGGFCSLKALSSRNDDPKRASRPFDKNRDGFVMAEAAATLILETEEHAKARGAKIYAEFAGYGLSGEGYHITQPNPDGNGCSRAMNMAVQDAGLALTDIDYINAHGTSTPYNDKTETLAVRTLFGEHANNLSMSSIKSHMGHSLGASGAVELAVCARAVQEGIMPPTINYEEPDPECDLDCVPNEPKKKDLGAIVSNSLGFGGHNVALCLKKYSS